ncbi:GcrA family cell cycle regulator [Streptomyces sp. NPDC001941]|uniref:GcrA family cell cycle regulator n=1 Tax=Streptomyces sp. NPDC001941 TaxID=3154659 RepID=UPI0033169D78
MRRPILPGDTELAKLWEAGLSHAEIARQFGVSRQAVNKRFNRMGVTPRAGQLTVTDILPWDLASFPQKGMLRQQEPYIGLRAFVRKRIGENLSARSELARKSFVAQIGKGLVLDIDPSVGAHYVKRDPKRDGTLVIRWPEDVPRGEEATNIFQIGSLSEGSSE